MANGWTETMQQLRGITVTYWKEVEDIIEQGDDAIIKYLMDNHPEYRKAGKLQAEAFVEEWQKKIDDLKRALREVAELAKETQYSAHDPGSSNNSGGPGGGKTDQYRIVSADGIVLKDGYATSAFAESARKKIIDQAGLDMFNSGDMKEYEKYFAIYNKYNRSTVSAYAKGGLVDYTGMAMVHGSQSDPEAFLSSSDTRLMRGFLDSINTLVSVPRMSGGMDSASGGSNGYVEIENIIVQIETLGSDTDYEEMARRVGKAIYHEITVKSGTPVGGAIRY